MTGRDEETGAAIPGWWQRGVIYEIYPRSFQDSNGDGIGDLRGLISRLDYCVSLGVDALWIAPFYPSPMRDFGYDVAEYTAIDPLFGDFAAFDELLAAAHERGLKIILDFVPNHTSDQHPWFQEARRSRTNPRRDWYLWRDPAPGGGPPNNWRSQFGGSVWELDELTGQYYYHAFLKEQPDLNWRNPAVRRAMHDVLRFWLDRGVDGFRVDVLWHLIKDDQFRDNPPNPDYQPGRPDYESLIPLYTADRPEVHDIIAELRAVVDEYDERVLIGEIYLPIERLVTYYGVDLKGVHLPFNFQLLQTPWNARDIATLIDQYERALPAGGWPNWVLGNHDRPRIATRVGPLQARVAAMLLLTLRGTPTIYYGDELGMSNVDIPPECVQDPYGKNVPGQGLGRDPMRTPMQWAAGPNAEFTTGRPWLPLAPDYQFTNVATESEEPASMLRLHQELLKLRRAHPALSVGDYEPVATSGDLLAYLRCHNGKRMLVALNLGSEPLALALTQIDARGRVILSTYLDRVEEDLSSEFSLRADEGIVVALE
ncbi:MAG TPA: alpha-amylase family glycosyl hydrolase [Steroidobacteraceae bacterium]